MNSILYEVTQLNNKNFSIDYTNKNRHCVVLRESDGNKTAYCFSTPIYNINSRKVVDFKFYKENNKVYAIGSNTYISVADKIYLQNEDGYCSIPINNTYQQISKHELRIQNDIISPTLNGIVYKTKCGADRSVTFELEVSPPFKNIRANDKCFSLMKEKYRPFLTVSCIGTVDLCGKVIAPATIIYKRINDTKYSFEIKACGEISEYVMFEVNLYEEKLIQDTTVESKNPTTNNAFGSVAFIGNTDQFGEQWLYLRPNFNKMSEFYDKRINRVVLHLPKLNNSSTELSAYRVASRFCSFGSNWQNKVPQIDLVSNSFLNGRYQSIDVTNLFVDQKNKYFNNFDGVILKSKVKGSGSSVVTTGDSYYAPQILEINYK